MSDEQVQEILDAVDKLDRLRADLEQLTDRIFAAAKCLAEEAGSEPPERGA